MKCVVPGPNVKILGRAIHSLAKLGDDLYVESSENELFFRTVNTSKTAYASYTFYSNFFLLFSCEKSYHESHGAVTCQISMRSALSIFKSPLMLEKATESLQIYFQPNSDKLVFIIKFKKGVTKTFNVPVIDCEALQAYYSKDSSPNSITIQPKIVGEILSNFPNHQDEITWKVTKNNMTVKNYCEPEDECSGMRTGICVDKDEFDFFKIECETEITFCVKELRAVLLFSDSVSLPLTANFSICSKPLVFVIKNDIFEVNIVVSTLSDSSSSIENLSNPESSMCDSATNNFKKNCESLVNGYQPEADPLDNEVLSGRERLKEVFRKCFDKDEFDIKNLPGYDIIYAPDSDPDE